MTPEWEMNYGVITLSDQTFGCFMQGGCTTQTELLFKEMS